MPVLNNPWFVGIVGGIISGVFTTLITKWIFSKRERREYFQRVSSANQEVIYAIRPGISEGSLPSPEVIEAMVSATARKYGINAEDMWSIKEIVENLIKEVMDSDFISAKSKAEFCERLSKLIPLEKEIKVEEKMASPTGEKAESEEMISPRRASKAPIEYRERLTTLMAMMFGLFAALMTFTVAWVNFRESYFLGDFVKLLLPTIVSVMGFAIGTYLFTLLRLIERKRQQRGRNDNISSGEESNEPS